MPASIAARETGFAHQVCRRRRFRNQNKVVAPDLVPAGPGCRI